MHGCGVLPTEGAFRVEWVFVGEPAGVFWLFGLLPCGLFLYGILKRLVAADKIKLDSSGGVFVISLCTGFGVKDRRREHKFGNACQWRESVTHRLHASFLVLLLHFIIVEAICRCGLTVVLNGIVPTYGNYKLTEISARPYHCRVL